MDSRPRLIRSVVPCTHTLNTQGRRVRRNSDRRGCRGLHLCARFRSGRSWLTALSSQPWPQMWPQQLREKENTLGKLRVFLHVRKTHATVRANERSFVAPSRYPTDVPTSTKNQTPQFPGAPGRELPRSRGRGHRGDPIRCCTGFQRSSRCRLYTYSEHLVYENPLNDSSTARI